MAETTSRTGAGSQADAVSGTNRSRMPIPAAAPSARMPNMRVTHEVCGSARWALTPPVVPNDPNGGTAMTHHERCATARRDRARWYTPRVLDRKRVRARGQEVNDRATRAHRPSREAVGRPPDSVPLPRRWRHTGEVYLGLGSHDPGLFLWEEDISAHCRVADSAASLTHVTVRSLAYLSAPCTGRPLLRRGGSLMPATVIVGLQWGDEGKGKTTDFLAEQTSMVVRYQGGDNAGHTVVRGDEVFKLRLTPSGVLYPHMTSVIGNGVVVNPTTLIDEFDMLTSRGIDVDRVRVSRSAHVIMPYHVALDRGNEARREGAAVGTTGRGIGPTYGDRAWRLG